MAINATPGSPTADGYATLVEATAYFAASLYATAWTTATVDNQERAIKMATRLLDAYFKGERTWLGQRTFTDQALDFPRTGLMRDTTIVVDSTTIPPEIRNTTLEFGKWLLANNPNEENTVAAQGITKIKVSSIELNFREIVASRTLPDFIKAMIPPEWYLGGIVEDDFKSSIFEVV